MTIRQAVRRAAGVRAPPALSPGAASTALRNSAFRPESGRAPHAFRQAIVPAQVRIRTHLPTTCWPIPVFPFEITKNQCLAGRSSLTRLLTGRLCEGRSFNTFRPSPCPATADTSSVPCRCSPREPLGKRCRAARRRSVVRLRQLTATEPVLSSGDGRHRLFLEKAGRRWGNAASRQRARPTTA